jgi:hypothetical protein
MNILVAWREALLNVSCFLRTVEDSYDSKSCWYFETQICRGQCSFECIQEASFKDSIVWVCHVDHVEGHVFSAGILGGAEGHWECYGSDRFHSFPAEAIEGL